MKQGIFEFLKILFTLVIFAFGMYHVGDLRHHDNKDVISGQK